MADTSKIFVARISAAISRGVAIVRELISWPVADGSAKWELPKVVEPRRLTLQDQWNYLSDIITGAASRAQEASRCQASATLQLDLAQYALTSLVDELSAVMDMGGRRRRATVHVLGIAPAPIVRPVGDAIAA